MSDDRNRRLIQLRQAYAAGIIDQDTYQAAVVALGSRGTATGSGAVAPEPNSTAIGERGVHVGGSAGLIITGDHNVLVVAQEVADRYWAQFAQSRPISPDLSQATGRYLRHLVERYRYLDYRGMGLARQLSFRAPLLDTYVPLKARIELPRGETGPGHDANAGPGPSEPLPLLNLLQEHDGLVILGDPGAGKTTFLKYLALHLALGRGEQLGLERRLPLVLSLSAYASALAVQDIPLHRFLATFYRSIGLDLPLEAVIDQALTQGGALLLLDGLDEVKNVRLRHFLAQRLLAFFSFQRQNGNKFVFTSRMIGYREIGFVADGLIECTLTDFGQAEIEQFVTGWTQLVERAAQGETASAVADAAREKEELLATMQRNSSIRHLAATPLLLTILVLMKRQGVVLPEGRVGLYDQYVRIMLKHWGMVRSLDRPLSYELNMGEIMRVLAPLALWMHETGLGLVECGAVRRKLVEIYRQRGAPDPEQAVEQFLYDVQVEAGLLVEPEQGVYRFIHQTFQEYLAAVAVAQLGQSDVQPVVAKLAQHAADDNWHEVILLAVGYIGLLQQRDEAATDILLALLEQAAGEPGQIIILAGEALRDAWPDGVTLAGRATILATLRATMTDSGRIAPTYRAAAGRVLAQVDDPRDAVTAVDEMAFCYVSAGPFWMGEGNETHVNESLSAGYWISRFPITNNQFMQFVADGGYSEADFWVEAAAVDRWQEGLTRDWRSRGWRDRPHDYGLPYNLANHPAVGITWYEALAFTRWLERRWQASSLLPSGWMVRLPSEAEWEKAARGGLDVPVTPQVVSVADLHAHAGDQVLLRANSDPQRNTPWHGAAATDLANYQATDINTTNAVGCFPGGATPYGCEEMSGNVWEWTRSHYQPYPYLPGDDREDADIRLYHQIVLRGGAYWVGAADIKCTVRTRRSPNDRNSSYGFRIVAQLQ